MSFKFFNDRIVTSKVSLEEAMEKATNTQEVPSLDDILAKIDAENKQVKTAGTEAEPKTAEVAKEEESKVQVQVAQELTSEASSGKETKEAKGDLGNFGDKKAKPFGEKEETKCADDGKEEETECLEASDGKEEEKGCKNASRNHQLKIAKRIDFRSWKAEDVVKAWEQHGSFDACVKNVSKLASDAKIYCGLLQTASGMAKETLEKTADKKEKTETKKASLENKSKKGVWKKLAKLTDKERGMLEQYFRKLYGDGYVDALLADY